MTRYEYKVRSYFNNTSLNGTTTTLEKWEIRWVYADRVEVSDHGVLKFYDQERGKLDELVAAEPPHAWCELRAEEITRK